MAPLVSNYPVEITPLGFTNPIWIDTDKDGKIRSVKEMVKVWMEKYQKKTDKLKALMEAHPTMLPYFLATMREAPVKDKLQLFGEILPQTTGDMTHFMYRMLVEMPQEAFEVEAGLASLSPQLQNIARIKRGEGISMDDLRGLRSGLAKEQYGDILTAWFTRTGTHSGRSYQGNIGKDISHTDSLGFVSLPPNHQVAFSEVPALIS